MADIAKEQPAVYAGLGSAGMLCCRLVRGSTTAISNHSWGTAIDLTLNGVLDSAEHVAGWLAAEFG
jgi:D-alanyl-D-alanine dipeptidase